MLPPRPPGTAERIVLDVCARVDGDFAELRPGIAGELQACEHRDSLIEAERLATEAIGDRWGAIEDACERALADVHEAYLVQAAYVEEATDDLREHGAESWIAAAVIHHCAFRLAWDVLDDLGLLEEVPE